jgi:hypothetical protein
MVNRRNQSGRYDEPFVGFPKSVLESNSLRDLSPHACKLLFEIARQYKGNNNGNLTAAWTILKSRGWRSKTTLYRCKKELLERGLIYMTRKGHYPSTTELLAVTWFSLDPTPKFDPEAVHCFSAKAYRKFDSPPTLLQKFNQQSRSVNQ